VQFQSLKIKITLKTIFKKIYNIYKFNIFSCKEILLFLLKYKIIMKNLVNILSTSHSSRHIENDPV